MEIFLQNKIRLLPDWMYQDDFKKTQDLNL